MRPNILKTILSEQLRLEWPLIQGPLSGGPSTPELVAAVSNAGALGFLGAAYLPPNELEHAIIRIQKLTSRSFGINLFASTPTPVVSSSQIEIALESTRGYRQELEIPDPVLKPPFSENFEEQINVVLKYKPTVFSFTFGLVDRSIIEECRQNKIITIGTATTPEEGIALQEIGVDAVVAQGMEAGGHRGIFNAHQKDALIETVPLCRMMNTALRIPIIAAGGIMNGKDIAAALSSGAQAVQLGTAFLLCDESGTSTPYREALKNVSEKNTRFTRAFSGRLARGIENRFMIEMDNHENAILPFPAQNAFTRDIRKKALELGRAEFLSLWAGKGVDLIREMKTEALINTLYDETLAALLK